RLGARLETLNRNLLSTFVADAEAAAFDLLQRLLNLVQKDLLATPQAKGEGLQVLTRSEIHLVGQIVGVERHVLVERLLGALDDLVALRLEHLFELLELNFRHLRSGALKGAGPSGDSGRPTKIGTDLVSVNAGNACLAHYETEPHRGPR